MILDLRYLLLDQVLIFIQCDDMYILWRAYVFKPVISDLQKRPACIDDVQKLLRFRTSALGPKPASYSSRHDGDVHMLH
jgi:hypothetical protein